MPREKHITIDLTNLSVLRIVCATCQAAETVPVIPKYQPPARCPNHGCTVTWFVPKTSAARALQRFVTVLAELRGQMTDGTARIRSVIPASD